MLNGTLAPVGESDFFCVVGLAEGKRTQDGFFPEGTFWGGGVLIHPKFVLTAAHVVQEDLAELGYLGVGVGVYQTFNTLAPKEAMIEAKCVHVHPRFNSPHLFSHDLALIELETPVDTTPIALADNALLDTLRTYTPQAYILGFGDIDSSKDIFTKPKFLQKARVYIQANSVARPAMYPYMVDASMTVAGDPAKQIDAQAGDSGGPLFVVDDYGLKLVACVSWGAQDRPNQGVYATIDHEWIDSILG